MFYKDDVTTETIEKYYTKRQKYIEHYKNKQDKEFSYYVLEELVKFLQQTAPIVFKKYIHKNNQKPIQTPVIFPPIAKVIQ